MAESKKYYWLKLKRDFFKRHDIRIIEKMPNGKEYALLYVKLMLESIDHEGTLRFSEELPYDNEMLAAVTDTDLDIVEGAINLFYKLKIISKDEDGTIILPGVQQLIGSAVDNDAANRQRRSRERKKQAAAESVTNVTENVTPTVTKNNESKRKRIDKDKDKELKKERKEKINKKEKNCEQVAALFNSLCPSLPSLKVLSDSLKNDITDSLEKYSLDDLKLLFKKAEASPFLKGKNEREWVAGFDWLIKADNIAKVLNGNFDSKTKYKANYSIELFEQMLNADDEPPKTMANDQETRARAEALKKQLAGK